jgi:predicted nucleic-acid-binding protein
MISLDTNILIRIFIDEPGNQQQIDKIRSHLSRYNKFFVSQIVQVELVWVLQRSYDYQRDDISKVLEHMQNNSVFELQNADIFAQALDQFKTSNVDFSDLVILATSKTQNLKLLTLDKKLSRLPNTAVL